MAMGHKFPKPIPFVRDLNAFTWLHEKFISWSFTMKYRIYVTDVKQGILPDKKSKNDESADIVKVIFGGYKTKEEYYQYCKEMNPFLRMLSDYPEIKVDFYRRYIYSNDKELLILQMIAYSDILNTELEEYQAWFESAFTTDEKEIITKFFM